MGKKTGIIRGDILEVNLTDGCLKIRDDEGKNHIIKAMVSHLVKTMPNTKIEVGVMEGFAV